MIEKYVDIDFKPPIQSDELIRAGFSGSSFIGVLQVKKGPFGHATLEEQAASSLKIGVQIARLITTIPEAQRMITFQESIQNEKNAYPTFSTVNMSVHEHSGNRQILNITGNVEDRRKQRDALQNEARTRLHHMCRGNPAQETHTFQSLVMTFYLYGDDAFSIYAGGGDNFDMVSARIYAQQLRKKLGIPPLVPEDMVSSETMISEMHGNGGYQP